MKFKIGDKIFNSYMALALWNNPYSFKTGFSHCITTVKTASEERFSNCENVDLYYPSLGVYVYHQGTGCCIDSNDRMYHLEHDKDWLNEILTKSFNKAHNEAKSAKEKEIQRVKDWIETYQSRLNTLLTEETTEEKLIKERFELLTKTLGL